MNNIIASFIEQLTAAGLIVNGDILADGQLHRCGTERKPQGKDGSYKAFLDEPATIWWCNWQTGDMGSWTCTTPKDMTVAQRNALRHRIDVAKAETLAEREKQYVSAAHRASCIWEKATSAPADHPYLTQKHIPPMRLRVTKNGRLLVPVRDDTGTLQSLQFISATGQKRFLAGGKIAGCFCYISAKEDKERAPLIIAEGYATAISIHLATGCGVYVAFSTSNLLSVSKLIRKQYPEREIILAADMDAPSQSFPSPGGVGLAKATEAALAINAFLAIPRREGHAVLDFNDLASCMGLGEVAVQVTACQEPIVPNVQPCPSSKSIEQLPPAIIKEKFPSGFQMREKGPLPGLWHVEMKSEGDPVETWIGPPLHILGATRDEQSNAWGLLLSWHDPDGREHIWAMPRELLVCKDASAWLGRLVSEGWQCASNLKVRRLLAQFLASYVTHQRARCVPRTGWHRDAFVLPDTVFYPPDVQDNAGQAGQVNSDKTLQPSRMNSTCRTMQDRERIVLQAYSPHNPFLCSGTLEQWRNSVAVWARGNSRLLLAVSAAFAAPLLELCGMESGGFNYTGQSSTGKTTALVIAASVWGKGVSSGGYVLNWRATSNGLEGMATLCSDALLCLDELGQAPGHTIQEAAYLLANGMGKGRAYQDGSMRAAKSWRCLVLSTGEVGLDEKIREEGGRIRAGQSVRLIDVPADAGAGLGMFEDLHGFASPQLFANALKQAAATNYGYPARAFIATLQQHRQDAVPELRSTLEHGIRDFCPSEADGQVKRAAQRFLLCAAAGESAAVWNILPWEKGEATQAAHMCFTAWLEMRGGIGAAEDIGILTQVQLFIEQHGQSRFQDVDRPDAVCLNRVGFRRTVPDGTEFYILPESFKAEICKGYDTARVISVLEDKGLLLPGDSRNAKRRPPIALPGYGRKRCYTILIRHGGHEEP